LTPADARNVLIAVQACASVTKLPAEIENRKLAGGPIGEISLRIARPQGATGTLPGILYCHGGG
jgi:acetyl esterase